MTGSTVKDHTARVEIDAQREMSAVLFADNSGKRIVSGDTGGNLRWWRAEDGKEVGETIQTGVKISAVALSPDRKWLVCGLHGSRSNVQVWDPQTRKKVRDTKGHTDTVTSVDITPDSTTIVTGSNDKYAMIWNITTGKRNTSLRHDRLVVAVRFSPSGDRLATATEHNSIRIYDSKDWKELLVIPCPFYPNLTSPLVWSVDGCQLYAASYTEVQHFDTSSGSLVIKRAVPGGFPPACIAVSQNKPIITVAAGRSLSFWDTAKQQKTGSVVEYASKIYSLVLSRDGESIATSGEDRKITILNLRDVLPGSYFTDNEPASLPPTRFVLSPALGFPFICVAGNILETWANGKLTDAENLLTEQILRPLDPSDAPLTLAYRALVLCRLKQYSRALVDAKESIKAMRSAIGYIALAIAQVYNGEYDMGMSQFDIALADASNDSHLVLLIKAIVVLKSGKYDDAIQRIDQLVDIVKYKLPYLAVRAHMLFSRGVMLLSNGDIEQATELLGSTQEAIPFQNDPSLIIVLLVFGWDFDTLAHNIQVQDEERIKPLEDSGDAPCEAEDLEKAIERYFRALSLHPSNPAGLVVEQNKSRTMLSPLVTPSKDEHNAIEGDPLKPQVHESGGTDLYTLDPPGEAVDAIIPVISLLGDEDPRRSEKCILHIQSEMAIVSTVSEVSKRCPIVLIDVKTGFLCNEQERTDVFKSDSQFKELVSSMTLNFDKARTHQVVKEYFEYVTFSHVWEGQEPSFQVVQSVGSIWKLDEGSPLNSKLRIFCQVVREDGHRWAWSDTCCIDKTISVVLNESLTMMYKWYEASVATYAYLFDVDLESKPGHGLKDCKWMTRAWTNQELLAPKVIRFYDRNWKPYLDDPHVKNHKESPRIIQELADATQIPPDTLQNFHPDNLSVREKLRIASTRSATREEDIAYSLIGIFQSDIRPHYGEGSAALSHLLEEIITRSGEVSVLSWTGKSSSFNSCLPATIDVYQRIPHTLPHLDDAEMTWRVIALKMTVSDADAMRVYQEITCLQPARFANRRLYLPCIIFAVKRIGLEEFCSDGENHYRARVRGIGDVEFHTSDRLSVKEPHKLIFVYPWIRDLRGPTDGFSWAGINVPGEDSSESEPEDETSRPLHPIGRTMTDRIIRALRLFVRLRQPFPALLLEQQSHDEFKRVAADHEIVVQNLDTATFLKHFSTKIVEVL